MIKVSAFLVSFFVILDLITKYLAEKQGWVVINTGISLGFLSFVPAYFLWTMQVLVLVVGLFLLRKKVHSWGWMVAMSLWIAGGIGNSIDRIWVGGVRDWISIPFLPIHNNLADWMIGMGVVIGIWNWFQENNTSQKHNE